MNSTHSCMLHTLGTPEVRNAIPVLNRNCMPQMSHRKAATGFLELEQKISASYTHFLSNLEAFEVQFTNEQTPIKYYNDPESSPFLTIFCVHTFRPQWAPLYMYIYVYSVENGWQNIASFMLSKLLLTMYIYIYLYHFFLQKSENLYRKTQYALICPKNLHLTKQYIYIYILLTEDGAKPPKLVSGIGLAT